MLQKYIEPKKTRREFRYQVSKRDEVLNFHPKVTAFLEDKGWNTKHHVKLASGHIIDLVAETEGSIYVIECKPKLSRGNFFTAIGQTLCYSQEYSTQARVAIATYSIEVDDYIQQHCDLLGIEIIEITS